MQVVTLKTYCLTLLLALSRDAYARNSDKADENDDVDGSDFVSSNLNINKPNDLVEVQCNGLECAADMSKVKEEVPSVWTRGLVKSKLKPKRILQEHARAASNVQKNFVGETLGYVTPWNSQGYDLAKRFRTKFTYISPVWLQLREDSDHVPIITGVHDIDRQWVQDVKYGPTGIEQDEEGPAIVPRVIYERNRLNSDDVPLIIDKMLTLTNEYDFDGIVFEIAVMEGTVNVLKQIARAFRAADKLLILVLSRCSKEGDMPVTRELFAELAPAVHRFSMNAYDFSKPGPNAPYPWLKKTLEKMSPMERQRILMGLPFYGYDNADAITGSTYIQSLKDNNVEKIQWDAAAHVRQRTISACIIFECLTGVFLSFVGCLCLLAIFQECKHVYTDAKSGSHHVVYFPCLRFLQDRLTLFNDRGVGVAIWELGQGLDFFYDLL